MLQFTRRCLELREASEVLRRGSMRIVVADEQLLVFERALDGAVVRCTFNLSEQDVPYAAEGRPLLSNGNVGASLGAYSGIIETVS